MSFYIKMCSAKAKTICFLSCSRILIWQNVSIVNTMPNLNIVFLTQVAALNQSLVRTVVTTDDDVAEMDTFPAVEGEDASKMLVRIKIILKL